MVRMLSEGRVHPPRHPSHVVTWKDPNPLYPSVPLGMRVSDLPLEWNTNPGAKSYGIYNSKAKLNPSSVEEMRELYEGGETLKSIAEAYGVDRSTVGRALRGITWAPRD